ncbi:MAG: DNA repair protein RecN [Marivibrio sp.]|uniref:DNA repair protein RecN n=1 Tax=Marivibrio sp. TaxID=2039719 RepID=UPI0032ECEBB8
MLTDLSIRDVVLIDRLDLDFTPGLAVLTGETGAGKSILLDSLGLALGRRADAKLVRPDAEKASVTAAFRPPEGHPVWALLDEHEIAPEDQVTLKRVLSADGRSKAFVNDSPCGVGLLKQIGETLVEIQGQFDQQGLMDAATHIRMLDAYGRLGGDVRAVRAAHDLWRTAERALADARAGAQKARAEEEFLRYAVDELDRLAPKPGEEGELADKRTFLQSAEQITEAINQALEDIGGSEGAEARIMAAQRSLDRIADKAGGRLDDAVSALGRAAVEAEEALSALNRAGADLDVGGEDVEAVEERLFALRDAARKHQVPVDALPGLREELSGRLQLLESGEETLSTLEKEAARAKASYKRAADALSAARAKAAEALDDAVNRELPPLKLEKARFTTEISALQETDWGPRGTDRVAFTVRTNPGMPAGPLDKIASGGELSRFLLAIKVSLAEVGTIPTLVFDEVDSGVGGATAAAVGERLTRLSERVQLLVVTHSPQVAARGADHWRVAKTERGGQMSTAVERLDDGARREEIARMLSGAEITDEARAAADRLREGAKREGAGA